MASMEQCLRALAVHRQALSKRRGVKGTWVGLKERAHSRTTELCIVVAVDQKLPADSLAFEDIIPATLASDPLSEQQVPTDVQQWRFRVLAADQGTYRPAPGGCSIGHKDITAGTLGCVMRYEGRPALLTNNHVAANSNLAALGDPIMQPGPYDGGKLPIAYLEEFEALAFDDGGGNPPSPCPVGRSVSSIANLAAEFIGSGTRLHAQRTITVEPGNNLIDAAIAVAEEGVLDPQVLEIGPVNGIREAPELGEDVKKRGRTTRFSQGKVTGVDATIQVSGYQETRTATFVDQIITDAESAGGDSGSGFYDKGNQLVGLLFAGGDDGAGRKITIMCKMGHVLRAFPGLTLTILAVLLFSGCTMTMYAPWHRPPEIRQAAPGQTVTMVPVAPASAPAARPVTDAEVQLAAVMIRNGASVNAILAALTAQGLDEHRAVSVLNTALALRR